VVPGDHAGTGKKPTVFETGAFQPTAGERRWTGAGAGDVVFLRRDVEAVVTVFVPDPQPPATALISAMIAPTIPTLRILPGFPQKPLRNRAASGSCTPTTLPDRPTLPAF
jgi:hypothetical protein